ILAMFCAVALQAQTNDAAGLEKRLIIFTDQFVLAWMTTGDIRSANSMRVEELLNDPPCAVRMFADEKACKELSKEERADYAQTINNVSGLMFYRVLSHQPVMEWVAAL